MARPKKIVDETQETVATSEVANDSVEVVNAESKEDAIEVAEATPSEPVETPVETAEATLPVEPTTTSTKKSDKETKKVEETKATCNVESAPATKAYIVDAIPAYMAPNVNSAFGRISGIFVVESTVVNGAGESFTGGYTSTPGAGSKVKIYVKTADLA